MVTRRLPNPVRCKANRLRLRWPAEEPGTLHELPGDREPRWMVTLDRIRLIGLLQENPASAGFSYSGRAQCSMFWLSLKKLVGS